MTCPHLGHRGSTSRLTRLFCGYSSGFRRGSLKRRGTTALVCVVVCVLSNGCSASHEQGASGAGGGRSPSSAPTTPSAPPGPDEPQPPVLPDLARQKSTDGARAFATYFIKTLNYSHEAESTTQLRRLTARECDICTFLADTLDEIHRKGGYQRGGSWRATRFLVLPRDSTGEMNLLARIAVEAGWSTRFQGDEEHRIRARTLTYEMHLVWSHAGWALSYLGPA
jgi:Family of unknown function (DUF6318)